MVQKFIVERSGIDSSWLKSLGLKGTGMKLCVGKSGVEMSFSVFFLLLFLTYDDFGSGSNSTS